jgi:pimeloyl-ACP methyl ester carboxylesterase
LEQAQQSGDKEKTMPNVGNIFFHAHEGIKAGRRPPLILLHGAGGSHLYWPPQVRRLPGYCVYAVDLPGHGKSNGSGQQSIQPYCDAVIQWLREIGLHSVIIVGHSMGGAIALTIALEHPENVLGLALLGTGAYFQIDASLLEQISATTTFLIAAGRLVELSFSSQSPQELKSQAYSRLTNTRGSVLQGDLHACTTFDVRERISTIQQPTLVIVGEEDRLAPLRHAHFLHSSIPNSQMMIVPAAGHMVMLEQPQTVAEALAAFASQVPY